MQALRLQIKPSHRFVTPSSHGVAALLFIGVAVGFPAHAETKRDPSQKYAFRKTNPCPSTGAQRGPCKGYVVDHVIPLCAGGPDRPSNMQWQTVEAGKRKDKEERRQCANNRRLTPPPILP